MEDFPIYITSEIGEKFVKNNGNLLFLKSCIYTSSHYPVRLLIDEGKDELTCAFIVYISNKDFICIDTSSTDGNFQGIFKIPIDNFDSLCYNGCRFEIYVKEVLTK